MTGFIEQVFSLLTTPPGNLIYHLALAFSTMAAIQAVLIGKPTPPHTQTRRKLIGLGALLLSQIALFLDSGLVWQGIASSHTSLPVLDRAVATFCLIWIVWLWAFPARSRLADIANGIFILISAILFIVTYIEWRNANTLAAFNGTWQDLSWQIFSVFIAGLGGLILLLWQPAGWGIGLAVIGLNLLGHLAHLIWTPTSGDFSGMVRLGQLCAYPLLPSLARTIHAIPVGEEEKKPVEETLPPSRHYIKDTRAIHAWIQLAAENQSERIYHAAARAIAQTLRADLCYLIKLPQKSDKLILTGGYDIIREEDLPPVTLSNVQIPGLVSALQRKRPLRINPDDPALAELNVLAETIGLEHAGSALLLPLADERENWGGILLLAPYSNRNWEAEDQSFLQTASETLIRILKQSEQPAQPAIAQANIKEDWETTRVQMEQLRQENQKLLVELESLRRASDTEALLTLQREAEELIQTLRTENEQLRAQLNQPVRIEGSPEDKEGQEYLEKELRLALEEVARLQNALAGANTKILTLEMQAKHSDTLLSEHNELLSTIIRQLRQALSFITGYNELLLSEAVGILGSMQKKFLERAQASTERMNKLLDDLSHIAVLKDFSAEALYQSVDVNTIIDQAVASITPQLREKNITLNLELPKDLPALRVDSESLQQILFHLLENAGAVTPPEGEIGLHASIEKDEEKQPYLLFQVMDQGGGVAPEDLPLVFSKQRHADHTPISGIGDTGYGLVIARTLTEAHGGRIWLDSKPGSSSIFSVLLPVQLDDGGIETEAETGE